LFTEISEITDIKLKVKLASSFLKIQLPFQNIISDNVFKLTKWIDGQDEKIKVVQIADYLHCCERQVERIFQKKVGVDPKYYLKCVQMRQIINMVMYKGNKPLMDILFEKGHYDAPHFHKDFKRVMNMTPLEFLNGETTFAREIMRL
jgi:methylphosphotriester-DNA--protein-cysteine methyltransferase